MPVDSSWNTAVVSQRLSNAYAATSSCRRHVDAGLAANRTFHVDVADGPVDDRQGAQAEKSNLTSRRPRRRPCRTARVPPRPSLRVESARKWVERGRWITTPPAWVRRGRAPRATARSMTEAYVFPRLAEVACGVSSSFASASSSVMPNSNGISLRRSLSAKPVPSTRATSATAFAAMAP